MTIIVVACLATLAVCALFARSGKPAATRTAKVPSLDDALIFLINDVSRQPPSRRRLQIDHVMIGSRLRAMDESSRITL
ncbi:MAG: hypothetical protein ABI591_14620 [Kofleriaceae bacterium]